MENHTSKNSRTSLAHSALPQLYGSVKVGERGQVVIPLDARSEMGLQPGDKLLALGGMPGMQGIIFVKAESFGMFLATVSRRMSELASLLEATGSGAGVQGRKEAPTVEGRRVKRSRV